jgi:hypothetical protein
MLVFLTAAPQYKQWKQDNPGRDAKHEFPGIDELVVRQASAPFRRSRPLSPDEVLQHLVLLTERQLIARQVSREMQDKKDYHFTLTEKGETAYDRMATAKYMGEPLLPLLLDHRNEKLWTAFVVLAFLARPKSDALTDMQVGMMTGLTLSSVQTGRRFAQTGFSVEKDNGTLDIKPALFETTRRGKDTARALHRDQWILDGEDLTDVVAALAAAPVPPAAPAEPAKDPEDKKPSEPEKGDPEPAAPAAPSDTTAVAPPQAINGNTRIVLWLEEDVLEAFAESINGSTVEGYLQAFIRETAARALERREKQAKLDALKAQMAALEAELNTL